MTDQLWQLFLQPLSQQAFQKALIGGGLVAIVCGVIGCFVILKRMAFLGDALSHAMLAGVTAGYLFMQIAFGYEAHAPGMLLGSVIAGFITVALIAFVSRVSRIKEDTAIGIMYTGIFAIGGVLASLFSHRIHIDLYHFITGMVLGVEDTDLWMMAVVASFVLSVVILFYRHFQLAIFDPVMAASIGIPVVAIEYLLTTCTSLVVVSAVSIVGVVLVVGLLVTPAATAYLLCNRLHRMMILAALFGLTGVVGGLYLSTWIGNVATGPSIVIASTAQFLVVLTLAPRYGLLADWLRHRRVVPQQVLEDVLGSFRFGTETTLPEQEIVRRVAFKPKLVRRALHTMQRQNLLDRHDNEYRLTHAGALEAKRLLRAHRLWEAYLEQVGTPAEKVHERAHRLEHVHDEETVDYLDDRLGHPLRDPHGAEIPEDFVHLVPGQQVNASLLRQGHRAVVREILPPAEETGLRPGDTIAAGPREKGGEIWTFERTDGTVVRLDHDEADAVLVELVPQEPA